MSADLSTQQRLEAADAFNALGRRSDGQRVAAALLDGFAVLGRLCFDRVRWDVDLNLGADSFYIADRQAELAARREIVEFEVAETAACVRQQKYLATPGEWFIDWLARLCLTEYGHREESDRRLAEYARMDERNRQRHFVLALERRLPSARRSPLVLFRLFPLSVRIVAATAFADEAWARQLRDEQVTILPRIGQCADCHGTLLSQGLCNQCGNPLWNYAWLTSD